MSEFTPHDYQLRGAMTLVENNGAGLFLDPGLGKTATTLLAFDSIWRESGGKAKMLVITPIQPMQSTWAQETRKWDNFKHLTCTILHGVHKKRHLAEEADIYLINPEGVAWLFQQKERPKWDVLCIDESTKFKNAQSVRFKALKWQLPKFKWRWILTGTPAPNGLEDLFGQSYIMDSGEALGKYITHYRRNYFHQNGWDKYNWFPNKGSMKEIAEKLENHVLQLDAEDYLDMPELLTITRPVEIGKCYTTVYKPMEKEFYLKLGDEEAVAPNAAAMGTKCRQIANGAIYGTEGQTIHIHDAKLQALDEIVEETNGQPLLVLYEFKHDLARIKEMLGKEAVCITGLTGDRLEAIVKRFNDGEIRFLLAHPATLHGMNIQGACHHMVWFSLPWSLESYVQTVYRLYRQGQMSKIVFVYQLAAVGTVDEKVAEVLKDKRLTQDQLNAAISGRKQ